MMATVLNKNVHPTGTFRIECKGFAERMRDQEAYEKLEREISEQNVVIKENTNE